MVAYERELWLPEVEVYAEQNVYVDTFLYRVQCITYGSYTQVVFRVQKS